MRENLDLGSYRRAAARRAVNRDRVFAIFPRLFERRAQRAGTLSGGEQQMLAIGRGLMAEPKLLILDEPSLGLSPLLVEELFALIARIHADGVSVLLVEQNVVQSLEVAEPRLYPRRRTMRHVGPRRRYRRRSTAQTRLSGTLTHDRKHPRLPAFHARRS